MKTDVQGMAPENQIRFWEYVASYDFMREIRSMSLILAGNIFKEKIVSYILRKNACVCRKTHARTHMFFLLYFKWKER